MSAHTDKSPRRRAIEQFFIHWIAAFGSMLIRRLPIRRVRRLAEWLGWIVGFVSFRRQRMMEENLQVVFGDSLTAAQRREIRKLCVANISKTMLELIKLHWMTAEDLQRECHAVGCEHLDAALALGKGVILVTAHFGNWEWGGAMLSVLGYPMNVIARDATDPFTRDLINNARGSKGVRIFGRWDARVLLRALHANEIVAILPDQHAAEAAVTVDFMGRPADTATGPAIFALRSGAAIVCGFAHREPDDHIRLEVLPALALNRTGDYEADVRATTQLINDVLGDAIRAHPEQWLWLHNRWKEPRFNG